MRNIDEVKAEIKDFSVDTKLALLDLPFILYVDEKVIGISKTYYNKINMQELFAFTDRRIIFTDKEQNIFKEWPYDQIIRFEGKKGFLYSDFIFKFKDEELKIAIFDFKKIYPEIIKYIALDKIYDKKLEKEKQQQLAKAKKLEAKQQKEATSYNKLIEKIPESIRSEIIAYPKDKWYVCIDELKVLPDVLTSDETIVDFSFVSKTEHRKNEIGDTGMIVVTNKRFI